VFSFVVRGCDSGYFGWRMLLNYFLGSPCSCCGSILGTDLTKKDGFGAICTNCGHLVIKDGLGMRSLSKYELEDPRNQESLKKLKDFRNQALHDLGLWG
jgi:hypothetical protein